MVGPYLCDEWTLAASNDYQAMPAETYPDLDEQVASWNVTCAKNHALVGKKWPQPVKPPEPRWWEVWR